MIRKPRNVVLAGTAAAAVFLATFLTTFALLSNAASCSAKAETYDKSIRLVITAANDGCTYSLKVGQSFAVLSSGLDPWESYPPQVAGDGGAVQTGEAVSAGGPGWGIYYRATRPGNITLPEHHITIRISP